MAIDTGDTAWVLVSSALVLLMTPGLAFFYGGMARRKNLLSTIMMSFAIMGLIGVLWALWGYSLSFGSDNGGLIGGFNFLGLVNVGMGPSDVYAGAVAGLVAITPAAGFVHPIAGIPIGVIVAIVCYYSIVLMKTRFKFDDSLDVFAVHGVGGICGALATGIFASSAISGTPGLLEGNIAQLLTQFIGVVAVAAFAFATTWILGKLVDVTIGLRVGQTDETVELDLSQHGERAYGGLLR